MPADTTARANETARQVPVTHCFICGSASLSPVNQERMELAHMADLGITEFHGLTFQLNQCADCAFLQPDWLPERPDFFDRLYNQNFDIAGLKALFTDPYRDFIYQNILHRLDSLIGGNRKTLVDVGTGVGRFPFLAEQAGWQAVGCEANTRSVNAVKGINQTPLYNESFERFVNRGVKYQAVTFLDVLEHIPNPLAVLKTAYAILEKNGVIAIKVPHGKNQLRKETIRGWIKRQPPAIAQNMVHLNHFGPRSLTRALQSAGFTDVKIEVGAPEFSYTLSTATKMFRTATYYLARALPFSQASPLAFNLMAYARKA